MLRQDLSPAKRNIIIGEIISLMLESAVHKNFSIANITELIFPAIEHTTYRIFKEDGRVIGFYAWAKMSKDNADKFLSGELIPSLEDWIGGDNYIITDFIAPYGNIEKIVKDMKQDLKGLKGKWVRFKSGNKNMGIRRYANKYA